VAGESLARQTTTSPWGWSNAVLHHDYHNHTLPPVPPDSHDAPIPSTTATTSEADASSVLDCKDFDHLSYEQLGHRLKNGRRKKKDPIN